MNFPINVQNMINKYSKPMTKPDWRKGSFIAKKCNNHIKCISNGYCNNIALNEMYLSMGHVYTEKLIPDGTKQFNEDHFLSAYYNYCLDLSLNDVDWDNYCLDLSLNNVQHYA